MNSPRISFGIIVLNGEPFTRYNLRSLYPFAHQVIVVEGASPLASHMATTEGHSQDGTLELLRRLKEDEDPENKIVIVTAEDEGYPNGFWPGEKDEQSQAYAKRATGNWLWQIDIDEFYHPEDMQRVCAYLKSHPETTCLTFNFYHFWGGFDYRLEGGLLMSQSFAGEPWGAVRRVFKWEHSYRYRFHRPPTVVDTAGRNLYLIQKRNLSTKTSVPPIYMYHYSNVFPSQVIPKGDYYGRYYAKQGSTFGETQRKKFEDFSKPLDEGRAIRIFSHYGTYNWLRRFTGSHPPAILALRQDLNRGLFSLEIRPVDDIERILSLPGYQIKVIFLQRYETLRSYYKQIISWIKLIVRDLITYIDNYYLPNWLKGRMPRAYQLKIDRWKKV
jgi:hypothetical protein